MARLRKRTNKRNKKYKKKSRTIKRRIKRGGTGNIINNFDELKTGNNYEVTFISESGVDPFERKEEYDGIYTCQDKLIMEAVPGERDKVKFAVFRNRTNENVIYIIDYNVAIGSSTTDDEQQLYFAMPINNDNSPKIIPTGSNANFLPEFQAYATCNISPVSLKNNAVSKRSM